MSKATVAEKKKSGLRIPGFAQLQRLGKSLMLPIALLPAAGILLRLGQPDLLGGINVPVIGPFFEAMSAAGGAVFANLPLLFAIGVAIGFAKKADGSTALAAAAGYLVIAAVFKTMLPRSSRPKRRLQVACADQNSMARCSRLLRAWRRFGHGSGLRLAVHRRRRRPLRGGGGSTC